MPLSAFIDQTFSKDIRVQRSGTSCTTGASDRLVMSPDFTAVRGMTKMGVLGRDHGKKQKKQKSATRHQLLRTLDIRTLACIID